MRYDWEFIESEIAKRGITDMDMRDAGIKYDTEQRLMERMLKPFPTTIAKLSRILGCRQSDLLTDAPDPPKDDEDDGHIRRCVVCGRTFMPYSTTMRPDGTISVAGKYYCSFQCCEEANPRFKRKDNRNGLENFRGHGNNFTKRKKL